LMIVEQNDKLSVATMLNSSNTDGNKIKRPYQ
jgi:hypothetical protein